MTQNTNFKTNRSKPQIDEFKYIQYKIVIGILDIYENSRVFKFRKEQNTILYGIPYSLITLFLGWWAFSISHPFRNFKNSMEALHINFTGGIDVTYEISEEEYDDKVNYVWRNLSRKTIDRLHKDEVVLILEIQDEYKLLNNENFTEENYDFILLNLGKLDIFRIRKEEIEDVLEALKMYQQKNFHD